MSVCVVNNHLDRVFEQYMANYEKVFKVLYPAKNSTGFPERNLSVNFSKAYETVYPNAVTWFEFQFGEKNNLHYDAIIVNPEDKVVLLIESKRFSNPNKKIEEISYDISRICDSTCKYRPDFNRIDNFDDYKVLGVILADVWTEGKEKKKILDSFINQTFLTQYNLSGISCPYYYVTDFKILEKYHLTSIVWDVTDSPKVQA